MKFKFFAIFLLAIITAQGQNAKKTVNKQPSIDGIFANIETNKGLIVIQLEYQKTPVTTANFITLADGTNTFITKEKLKGKPFYDGLKFHRVIPDFMVQGGDPDGDGSGGAGYTFKDEFNPDLKHNAPGILSMANSGPGTNSSQFFITHKETPWLDGKHTVFGHVISGMDIVNAIVKDDVIIKITIVRKGSEAKKFNAKLILSNYFKNKVAEDEIEKNRQIALKEKKERETTEAKQMYAEKYAPVFAENATYLASQKLKAIKTPSGLEYVVLKKGTGVKPADGADIFVHYAGYLENGSLFDSSYEEVSKKFGKYEEQRAAANGYQPFPFQAGKKDGLIPGFLEAINTMSFGDKLLAFIPSNLAYGERGAGTVIPPNSNIIFEIELFDDIPTK